MTELTYKLILRCAIIAALTIVLTVASCNVVRWKAFAEGYEETRSVVNKEESIGTLWTKPTPSRP